MADYWPAADPDLQIRGGHSSRPLDKWGGGGLKKCFSALQASIWFKSKGGGVGPLPGSATPGCLINRWFLNPLSPKSDQHEISPCNINAL